MSPLLHLMRLATKGQKDEFLPQIAKGDITFALAYSESGSGTHFGSPDITEKTDGEHRILNGRKSFVTSAERANYYLTYTNSCEVSGGKNNWITPSNLQGLIHEEGYIKWLGMGNVYEPRAL